VRGFLLDSHVPAEVANAVKRILPDCKTTHLSEWRGGAFLDAADEDILHAAVPEELVLVTFDRRSIASIIKSWLAEGRAVSGVAFVSSRTIASNDIGTISRRLVHLYQHPDELDPAYPVVYLQPLR
jgi:hypothetical protein